MSSARVEEILAELEAMPVMSVTQITLRDAYRELLALRRERETARDFLSVFVDAHDRVTSVPDAVIRLIRAFLADGRG